LRRLNLSLPDRWQKQPRLLLRFLLLVLSMSAFLPLHSSIPDLWFLLPYKQLHYLSRRQSLPRSALLCHLCRRCQLAKFQKRESLSLFFPSSAQS